MSEATVMVKEGAENVRVPDYLLAWWTELGTNSATANATHVIWRVRGPDCVCRFRAAVRKATERHEILTGSVVRSDGCFYFAQRTSSGEPQVEEGPSGSGVNLSAECRREVERIVWTPFAENAAVFRPFVLQLSPTDAVCGFVIHHRVVDYYGCQILAGEIRAGLLSLTGGVVAAERAPLQFTEYLNDVTDWIAGEEGRRRLEFWRRTLQGAPPTRLPGAANLDAAALGPLLYIDFELDPALRVELAAAARSCRSTLASITLAVHQIALAAALNQTDITANVLVSGRESPALLGMVGYAADCVPVRAPIDASALFPTFVRQLQEAFLLACRHRVKWELVEEAMPEVEASSVMPVFNFVVGEEPSMSSRPSSGNTPELSLEPVYVDRAPERGSAIFNISHTLSFFDTGQMVYGHIKYMAMRHERSSVESFLERFLRCLAAVARDPFLPVGQILAS